MAGLNLTYEKLDDIPESINARELFTERNGKLELTGITGLKTQADIDRVQQALANEKADREKKRTRLQRFWELNDEQLGTVQQRLDKYEELEAQLAVAGKADDEKVNNLVEARIKSKLAPVEREKADLASKLKEASDQIATFTARENQRKIHDAVRAAKLQSQFLDTAEEDVLWAAERMLEVDEQGNVIARDGVGVTPGVSASDWLAEMQPKREHWWPETVGAGARGDKRRFKGIANNPWSADYWNLTEQGKYLREHGEEKAKQAAAVAGTTLGGARPVRKAA